MNYKHFYKQADGAAPAYEGGIALPGHYAYQLPALLALAGIGTVGGALLNKKKRLLGGLIGGTGLPAAYLAYLAAQKNFGLEGNAFDRFVNKYVNNPALVWRSARNYPRGEVSEEDNNKNLPFANNDSNFKYILSDTEGYVPGYTGAPIAFRPPTKENTSWERLGAVPLIKQDGTTANKVLTLDPTTYKWTLVDKPAPQ